MNLLIIFGAKYLYLVAVAITVIGFWLLPREKKQTAAVFGIISLAATYAVALLSGLLFNNPRPFVSEHITPLIPHAPNNGFPSDHVLLISALASVIYCYNRRLGLLAFAVAILVGASRVFASIHHWVDVASAIGIAVLTNAIIYKISRKYFYA